MDEVVRKVIERTAFDEKTALFASEAVLGVLAEMHIHDIIRLLQDIRRDVA